MNAPRDHRRIVPAYLATAGRARPGDTTSDGDMFDRLTVLHTPREPDADGAGKPRGGERPGDGRRPGGGRSADGPEKPGNPETSGRPGAPEAPGKPGRPGGAETPHRPETPGGGEADGELRAEQRRLLDLLEPGPLSLAEAAAHLRLPVSVVKVMVTDLVDAGRLAARAPVPDAELPERQIVEKVFDGLRALKSSR